jgi:hypothetical protein
MASPVRLAANSGGKDILRQIIEHRAVFTAGPIAQIRHRSYLNQA